MMGSYQEGELQDDEAAKSGLAKLCPTDQVRRCFATQGVGKSDAWNPDKTYKLPAEHHDA